MYDSQFLKSDIHPKLIRPLAHRTYQPVYYKPFFNYKLMPPKNFKILKTMYYHYLMQCK